MHVDCGKIGVSHFHYNRNIERGVGDWQNAVYVVCDFGCSCQYCMAVVIVSESVVVPCNVEVGITVDDTVVGCHEIVSVIVITIVVLIEIYQN